MKKIAVVLLSLVATVSVAADYSSSKPKAKTYVENNTIVDDGYLEYCLRQQIAIEDAVDKIASKDALITSEAADAQKYHNQVTHFAASQNTSPAHKAQYQHYLSQREKQRNLVLGLLEDRHRIFKRTVRLRNEYTEFCKGLGFRYEDIKRLCNEPGNSGAYSCQLVF